MYPLYRGFPTRRSKAVLILYMEDGSLIEQSEFSAIVLSSQVELSTRSPRANNSLYPAQINTYDTLSR